MIERRWGDMEEQLFNPDKWLNLGLPGAALFIVLIIIVLMFRQQGKSIDKLCEKLDNVTDAFSESNKLRCAASNA